MRKQLIHETISMITILEGSILKTVFILFLVFSSGLPGKLPNFACRTSFANSEISKIIELSSIASFIQTCSIC